MTAANSRDARATLTQPEDLALVDGYRRRKRRRRARIELAVTSVSIVGLAFVLVGMLGSGMLAFAFDVALTAVGIREYLSEKQMDGRLRAVVEVEGSGPRHLGGESRRAEQP